MTNYEKYKDLLINEVSLRIGVTKNGLPCSCAKMDCADCIADCIVCHNAIQKWLQEEYVEQKVDWSKVETDTKILVRDSEVAPWKPRHFACFKDGNVFSYRGGASSFTADNDITPWKYAKLYE